MKLKNTHDKTCFPKLGTATNPEFNYTFSENGNMC